MDKPIFQSLLDVDAYKLTMGQFQAKYYPQAQVRFGFTNRTTVPLASKIDLGQLREELQNLRSLSLTKEEWQFLAAWQGKSGKNILRFNYLADMVDFRIPEISAESHDGQLVIEIEDLWPSASYPETMVLGIVNELYFRNEVKESGKTLAEFYEEGLCRLSVKINRLKEWPSLKFSDFGTRRRFSSAWQELVFDLVAGAFAGEARFLGTSNIALAMKHGLTPVGTEAHERYMVIAALSDDSDKTLRDSVKVALRQWEEMYGPDLLIALCDTFGTESFLEDFREFAPRWSGLRPDSGEPFNRGELIAAYYRDQGQDPMWNTIVFSDGLTDRSMTELFYRFQNRIWNVFGWGTNLTNDLGLKPLSIVMKATAARWVGETTWRPTVKLSDNPRKCMSESSEAIARYKRVFNYQEKPAVDIVY